GILVTRSGDDADLGTTLSGQIMDQRKAPLIAGVVVCVFGLVPGLPKLPFFFIGALLIAVGWALKSEPTKAEREEAEKARPATPWASFPASRRPSPRSDCRPCGSPRAAAPRPRRSAGPSWTPSRSSSRT